MAATEQATSVAPFWEKVTTDRLAQGDFLTGCSVAIVPPEFNPDITQAKARIDVVDLIIMTQTCDLENDKAPLVACCPIHSIVRFEEASPEFKKQGAWERVRQGRVEGLHLLASTTKPDDKWDAYTVDFRSIYSLPVGYMTRRAMSLGARWRLRSPYLEHFSQAFARFFMRVGLPSGIPSYKNPPQRPPGPPQASKISIE